ncbi:MAG: tetratricopeptide repeat protein [Asgard group archaeon]|nr:tetratricopeptide repeat protein [Asgard group archaeon]
MTGDIEKEIDEWKMALADDENNLEALANLGKLLLEKWSFKEAESYLLKGHQLEPNDVWFSFQLANCYFYLKKFADAEKQFLTTLELDPENTAALNGLAFAKQSMGNLDGALIAFRQVLDLDPKNPTVLLLIGNIYFEKKDFSNAEDIYNKVIKIDPDYIQGYLSLCNIYISTKQEIKLREIIDKALTKFPYVTFFIQFLNQLDNVNQYIPAVSNAKIESIEEQGDYKFMIISNIETRGQIQYKFILYLYKQNSNIPIYYVSLEENSLSELGGAQYFFCAFTKTGHSNFGFFDKEATLENFSKKAIDHIRTIYKINS